MHIVPSLLYLAGNVSIGVLSKYFRVVYIGQLVDVISVGLKWSVFWYVVGGESGEPVCVCAQRCN